MHELLEGSCIILTTWFMRVNKYLYVIQLDVEKSVIFNGVNKNFSIIDTSKLDSFIQILQSPETYSGSHPSIIRYFKSLGFIVEDDYDEHAELKDVRNQFIHSKEYKTTIVPTYECNYNCWYCLQEHEPVEIEWDKILLIIKHIKKYISENDIESYVLSWFGGEPLTQPEIIDYVSSELLQFCISKNIDYSAGITTNGALLDVENIKMLMRNEVNYYQIAIDGDENTHNKNKHDKNNESSFALILGNIVELLRLNKKADVVLRLNYTLATLKSQNLIEDICKYIPAEFRSRIRVDLQKVWQVNEKKINIEDLRTLQENLVDVGFELCTEHVFSMCYVEKEHYNMFFYNGGVEKCDKRPIDKLRGYINDDGDIIWREKPIYQDHNLLGKGCVCNDCLYYPLCYCGCPMTREDRMQENNMQVKCGYCGDYSIFENRIRDYCWRVINNRKISNATK